MRYAVLGTAGHIDHGKSSLVKALTGVDPDRLKEEKQRGITIDLGFAELKYAEATVGIVDVPGHEKLIKNMLAGAQGIDMVLFVIAADESIMPQSREHLAICNLLGIKTGIVAITKCDLVDSEFLSLVFEDVRGFVRGTFLENAEIISVSVKDGTNIDNLKKMIGVLAMQTLPKSNGGIFRLPVDRVFTLKGFGTVVTGTAISGMVRVDDHIEIHPSGIKTKVRGLHSHNQPITTGFAGQRLAVNLQGVDRVELSRGNLLTEQNRGITTRRIDVKITLLKDAIALDGKAIVHFHIGTSELTARVIVHGGGKILPVESAYCQIRLKEPITAMVNDRFIIRRFSPVETIGGGIVLDILPPLRGKDMTSLEIYEKGTLEQKISEKIRRVAQSGFTRKQLHSWINEDVKQIDAAIEKLKKSSTIVEVSEILYHMEMIKALESKVATILKDFHKSNPLKAGISKDELCGKFKAVDSKAFFKILPSFPLLVSDKDIVRLKSFNPTLTADDENVRTAIVKMLKAAGFQPPLKDEIASKLSLKLNAITDILKLMASDGTVSRINDSIYLLKEDHSKMLTALKEFSKNKTEISVSEFRDLLQTSRKYALPFLEHLDGKKITMRIGEARKIIGGG
ncbi:MAG: selenocysteine-specific translation elongation factor [Nitrospirae bacterium]|nr:selenocysteine-specific translation elongation factor [Nitrospirota bacterium]MBF0535880.1 selenocysteine-specific translation elongation factor [Nitrospirota bacterium]MBF0617787.1 selenocysteine-specific translation elongation factor [Nitrospirota bacterium]